MYIPLNYEKINWIKNQFLPSTVKPYNNLTYNYWERALYQRICSVIDFDLPPEWCGSVRDFFYWCLIRCGFLMISENDKYGYFFQPCHVSGISFYYQPTYATVSNPKLLKKNTYKIGKECELLKLTPDFMGWWDLIAYYAEKLSTIDTSINTSIINSKYAFVMGARNKAEAETLKKMLDSINRGEPAVIYDRSLTRKRPNDPDEPFFNINIQDVGANYVLDKLLREQQTIINNFDNEIGIPTVPYQKKERMVTDEANSKTADALSRISVCIGCLDSSIEKIHELYPDLNISYTLRTLGAGENVKGGEDVENNPDGDV